MAKSIRYAINERYVLILKTISEVEKTIAQLPDGWLIVRKVRGNYYYYYNDDKTNEKLLNEDDAQLIHQLLQKKYLKDVLKAAKKELTALEKMQKLYPTTMPEELYEQLPESHRAGVEPIILGDIQDAKKWMNEPYVLKPFKKGVPVYKSIRGERVRSKSEVMIADRMYARGVPYKYECPIMIGGKVIHPDFSSMRMSDHKIIYHEHCGMMDDPDYVNDLVERVNLYNQAGIIQGDRLTFTFETSDKPLDIRVIDRLIDEFFK